MDKQESDLSTSIQETIQEQVSLREAILGTAYSRLEEQRYNRVGEAAAIHGFVSWLLAAHKTISDQVPFSEIANMISQYCDVQGWQIRNPGNWLEGVRPMPGLPLAPAHDIPALLPDQKRTGHYWRVEVLCDCHGRKIEVYAGESYEFMVQRVGQMCLSTLIDKIFVWRDQEKFVHLERHGGGKEPIYGA